MKKIIIVGGGFAGMNLYKKLEKYHEFDVTLVDANNYNFFPPLLYQVATAFIEPSNISYPFRKMFQGNQNFHFHLGALLGIDSDHNTITTDSQVLSYDYLVLAMGTETNFFGNENVERNALPMKTVNDALNLRNHILLQLEKATITNDIEERKALKSIVIAGGGATGVEIAGMLADMSHHILSKDYPDQNIGEGGIYLVDGNAVLLAPMSAKAQREAYQVLDKRGVHILLNTLVSDYTDNIVTLGDGTRLPAATLIWTSGVVARKAPGLPEVCISKGRRISVDEYNRVASFDNIFAIGDQCLQTSDIQYPTGHPQLAQVAIQQGTLLAENLNNTKKGTAMRPFSYQNKGSMAAIAKYKSVVDFPKGMFMKGFFAWFVWLFIHIIPIAGFRNKFKLAGNWMVSFLTNDPTLRLILRPEKNKSKN